MLRLPVLVGLLCAIALQSCQKPDTRISETDLSEVLRQAGEDSQAAFDYAAASEHFRKLSDRKPEDIQAWLAYARNLRYSGRAQQAMRVLRTRMPSFGEDPRLLIELGKAQLAASIAEAALVTLKRATQKAPGSWDAHAALGIAYDRLGRFAEARGAYQRALALSKDNVAVLNNLALSRALAGDIGKGIAILERVYASPFSTPLTRQNLAMLHGVRGDVERARELGLVDLAPDMVDQNIATLKLFGGEPRPASAAPAAALIAPSSAPSWDPTAPLPAGSTAPESQRTPPEESTRSLEW